MLLVGVISLIRRLLRPRLWGRVPTQLYWIRLRERHLHHTRTKVPSALIAALIYLSKSLFRWARAAKKGSLISEIAHGELCTGIDA